MLAFKQMMYGTWGFLDGSEAKEPIHNAKDTGDAGSIPGSGRFPRGRHATHSGILAWVISWTEEPGGLQSKGSRRVIHD